MDLDVGLKKELLTVYFSIFSLESDKLLYNLVWADLAKSVSP
jgi:hypothetical protein